MKPEDSLSVDRSNLGPLTASPARGRLRLASVPLGIARAEDATVTLLGTGGRGVLIPGGFILTAAHCIKWDGTGRMITGDDFYERVQCGNRELLLCPRVAEPVADVALLGPPDDQQLPEDAESFAEWLKGVEPVPLFAGKLDSGLLALNADRKWVKCWAGEFVLEGDARACLKTKKRIEPGASGGPIITEAGKLVGIMSQSSDCFEAHLVRPLLALPVWAVKATRSVAK